MMNKFTMSNLNIKIFDVQQLNFILFGEVFFFYWKINDAITRYN